MRTVNWRFIIFGTVIIIALMLVIALPFQPVDFINPSSPGTALDLSTTVTVTFRVSNLDAESTYHASVYQTQVALGITPTPPPSATKTTTLTPIYYSSAFAAVQSATARAQLAPSATATATPTQYISSACAFSWARQSLPDVTARAQARLDAAHLPNVKVEAEAYGEDCYNAQTKTTHFGAMSTDFYVTMPVPSLDDDALSALVVTIDNALTNPPMDNLPAYPGYLDITFTSGEQTKIVRATFREIQTALDQGLTGAALLHQLGG